MIDLNGKNVIITGGTHGIGETTAILFSELGASVWIIGRNEIKGNEIESKSPEKRIKFLKCDLSVRSQVEILAKWIDNSDTVFDVLINNASRNSRFNVLNIPMKEWDEMIELNLSSTVILSKHVASKMIKSNIKGRIINIGAIQSFFPLDSSLAYSAVKGALRSITKSMAVDLGKYGIIVSLVMPGPIYAKTDKEDVPEDLDKRAATLIGRMGRKLEVAKLLAFLASDDNTFMTGNEIIIDGGRSISRKPDPEEIEKNIL